MTIRIWSDPHPDHLKDRNNGIAQVIHHLARLMPEHGYVYASRPEDADLFVRHAGARGGPRVDVTHNHGLLPTGMRQLSDWAWSVNADVIDNLISAQRVTVPSQWVAEVMRREMRFSPEVVHWGIEPDEWQPGENGRYVLWAKGRSGDVCDTAPVMALAAKAHDQSFITTFGETAPHVRVVGVQPFEEMKRLIRNAGVYLATTRETFGIQTLEAMACGVPVLGYRWAATPDLVSHMETGYLAEPGDLEDLERGLRYCLKNRRRLSAAAREAALLFTWERTAAQIADIYQRALEPHQGPLVSIIIPCFNYARWVGEAIESVLRQSGDFEVIVVNDASTDQSRAEIDRYADRVKAVHKTRNEGVSAARNDGARLARGKYLAFLDADDHMEPGWLKATVTAMQKDDRAGIAYTALRLLLADGTYRNANWPPTNPDPQRQLLGENIIPTCCLIRREAFERAGGYSRRFEPTEDGELWLKIVECGYEVRCASPKPLFTYRMHEGSLSRRNPKGPDTYMPWHIPSRIGEPPFAAAGRPSKKSWPVRDYDRPVITVLIQYRGDKAALIETLDSLVGQTYHFWDVVIVGAETELRAYPFVRWSKGLETEIRGPLVMRVEAGDCLNARALENGLHEWQTRGVSSSLIWKADLSEREITCVGDAPSRARRKATERVAVKV